MVKTWNNVKKCLWHSSLEWCSLLHSLMYPGTCRAYQVKTQVGGANVDHTTSNVPNSCTSCVNTNKDMHIYICTCMCGVLVSYILDIVRFCLFVFMLCLVFLSMLHMYIIYGKKFIFSCKYVYVLLESCQFLR